MVATTAPRYYPPRMPQTLGALCIILHGHLPYVLHHGVWPHGEAWLYEAGAETYLPLLEIVGEVALHRGKPALTIGLTPVLLEQLAHPDFKTGFVAYLRERIGRAGEDRKAFEAADDAHSASLALHLAANHSLSEIQNIQIREADLHDNIFPQINLAWWMP